jgi:hypothetical protein
LEDAELVAPRVTHDPEVKAALLLVVIAGRTQRLQASDLRFNIIGLQVQVHPFLGDLVVVGALEQHPDLGIRESQQSVDGAALLRQRFLGGRTSFNEWADRWLDSTVNLRANTKDGYRSILRRYLRPAFGSYPLARIDVLAVRTWLAKLEADGVGQATRAKAYRLLARILGAAVEARFIAVNPCGIRGGGQR